MLTQVQSYLVAAVLVCLCALWCINIRYLPKNHIAWLITIVLTGWFIGLMIAVAFTPAPAYGDTQVDFSFHGVIVDAVPLGHGDWRFQIERYDNGESVGVVQHDADHVIPMGCYEFFIKDRKIVGDTPWFKRDDRCLNLTFNHVAWAKR